MKHTLDKHLFLKNMNKRGWRYSPTLGWCSPLGCTRVQEDKDFTEAHEESMICPHEKETKNDPNKPNPS